MGLVVCRRRHEAVVIADEIKVSICDVRGGKVLLRIEAPKDITIHREEIWQKASADVNRVATPEGESGRQVANTHEA